jgi:hypothetical protein
MRAASVPYWTTSIRLQPNRASLTRGCRIWFICKESRLETRKYEIHLENQIIALGFISPHPNVQDAMVASVFPITRSGSATEDTLTLGFGPMSHEDFSPELSGEEMIRKLIAPVIDGLETASCTIVEVDLRDEAKT